MGCTFLFNMHIRFQLVIMSNVPQINGKHQRGSIAKTLRVFVAVLTEVFCVQRWTPILSTCFPSVCPCFLFPVQDYISFFFVKAKINSHDLEYK